MSAEDQGPRISLIAVLGAVIAGGWLLSGSSPEALSQTGPEKQPKAARREKTELQTFMRQKLAASNQILEGLCTEDLSQVAKAARQLHQMSAAEQWHVQNDVIYKQSSAEFQQITADLVKAADEKNLDRAVLKWMDATMSCVDCHRFVRGMRIADRQGQ